MVIERVHGLQATSISLNERFTILASISPVRQFTRSRRASAGGYNISNHNLVEQIAQRLGQTKQRGIHQRIGFGGMRRFGSESSLPGLRRSNSFSNLSQRSVKTRIPWRPFNGNLSRSASFSSLSQGVWRGRGFRRRGGRMGLLRGKMRGRGRQQVVGRLRGRGGGRGGLGRLQQGAVRRTPARGGLRGAARGGGRGRGRGQARGGATRQQKPVPSKEELDLQLDQYMASTKSALDKELDAYMKNAMEME